MHPRTPAPATRRQYGAEEVPKGAEEVSRYLKRGRLGGGTTELSQVRLMHPPHTHTQPCVLLLYAHPNLSPSRHAFFSRAQ
jgi:hypothetical protein